MKRIFSFVLLSVMLLSSVLGFTSCSDAGEVNDAVSLTKALSSLDVDVYTKINANMGSKTQEIELMEKLLISGDKVQLTKGAYGTQGEAVYMDGEYAYVENDGSYVKTSLDEYVKENGSYDEKINCFLVKLPSSFFEDADISKTGNKLSVIKEADAGEFAATFSALTDILQKELGVEKVESSEYKNCKLSIIVKDGYVTEMSLSYNFIFTANKKKCTANIKTSLYVNNPGNSVEVNMPQ